MAYLVQRKFKNRFYDFQISKCEYVPDGSTLDEMFGDEDDFEYCTEEVSIWYGNQCISTESLCFMKVYPLREGNPIKGHSMYWYKGYWRTKQQIIEILKQENNIK